MACFKSLPRKMRRMVVWISLDENHEIVDFLEYSVVIWLKMSLTKEFKMAIALLDILVLFKHLVDV
jgi:hypothetical protein